MIEKEERAYEYPQKVKSEPSFKEIQKRILEKTPKEEEAKEQEERIAKPKKPSLLSRFGYWLSEKVAPTTPRQSEREKRLAVERRCPDPAEVKQIQAKITACPEIVSLDPLIGSKVNFCAKIVIIINGIIALAIFLTFLLVWLDPSSPFTDPTIRIAFLIASIVMTGVDMFEFGFLVKDKYRAVFMFFNISLAFYWLGTVIFFVGVPMPLDAILFILLILADVLNGYIVYTLQKMVL
jgi:hypothetical protein